MIGISITTRNRPEVFNYTLNQLTQNLPPDSKVIIVDDSDKEYFERYQKIVRHNKTISEYILNEERTGIPHSKNKAFQKLKDCECQFWFDDDCFPKHPQWANYVINCGKEDDIPHYLYLKTWYHLKKKEDYKMHSAIYQGATACFMYFNKKLYDVMEGFHEGYLLYGHWHGNLSIKIHKAGHTPGRFVTLRQLDKYIHAFDIDGKPKGYKHGFSSSLSLDERKSQLVKGMHNSNESLAEIMKRI